MNDEKKELKVAALENGTVIDHIPSSQLFKVVSILGLENCTNSITIGNNLASKKIGKKGIIKVADRFFKEEDLNKIALVAPAAQINIIRDYQVIEKRKVSLPDIVHGIIRCGNPKCITNNEPMETIFHVTDKIDVQVKCHYCAHNMAHSSRLFLITRLMIPSILAHFSQNGGKFFQQMLNQHWVYPVHSTLYLSLDICGRKDAWFIT